MKGFTIVAAKSFEMKLVTKSSKESVLAVEDRYLLWIQTLLENQGFNVNKPINVIYQPSKLGSYTRSKHLIAKYGKTICAKRAHNLQALCRTSDASR